MRQIVALLLGLWLVGGIDAAWADGSSESATASNTAAALADVLYTPLKTGLCVIGGGASGLVFLSSGPRAARAVFGRSCGGTWILTGDALRGKKAIDFVGDSIRFPPD